MKRSYLCALLLSLIFVVSLAAQTQTRFIWSSSNYQVFTDSSEIRSLEISQKTEAALDLFNTLFHFDSKALPGKLKVRVFAKKDDYNLYLQRLISETRSDFVFVSYSDPSRNELVGFEREEDFDASLIHYGFIQYLNAYIPAAPLWLEEGMAAYLESSIFNPDTNSYIWQPNLIWLDSLKNIFSNPEFSLSDLLRIDMAAAQNSIDTFYPAAWGLIHFLMNSEDKRHNRILWDSISALDQNLNLSENSALVIEKAFWIAEDDLEQAFRHYILSLKTFNDWIKEGVEFYSSKDMEQASSSFKRALALRSDNYIPHYYLGLISYELKNYPQAHSYYGQALGKGIDPALVNYALGVNAFADKDYDSAEQYLIKSKALDTDLYGEKAQALIKRIEFLK